MRRTDTPTRATGLAATTTTLLALMAVAGAASSLRGLPVLKPAQVEIAVSLGESRAVRAVAAAVAAAAKDLLIGHQAPAILPGFPQVDSLAVADQLSSLRSSDEYLAAVVDLDERLLDLPPPRC